MSLCPWGEWTGGKFKNFNLLSDLLPQIPPQIQPLNENIDPELTKFVEQSDTISVIDSVITEEPVLKTIPHDFITPKIDGYVAIEDYSLNDKNLEKLSSTLKEASSRNVRIALVGDSYIEGDIFAQDVRSGLQSRYGGCGVGYIAAFSSFPGFRSSVNQASSGWEEHEIRKMKDDPLRTILGTYYTAKPGADTRFRKSVKPEHLDVWDRTTIVFKADSGGVITISSPEFGDKIFNISPSKDLQSICVNDRTGDVRLKTNIPKLEVLGIWLEGNKGIVLDCISLRGNSGISHRVLNSPTTTKFREFIDYDLIVLEFGMNALSATQTNYTSYGNAMVEVVNNLKHLYPNAQILILGVGDRGQKNGGDVISMPTVNSLIKTQRDIARRTGSMFWDTREAMGGDGAALEWHQRKLLNSDYVHLNHRGGTELGKLFLNSLFVSLK